MINSIQRTITNFSQAPTTIFFNPLTNVALAFAALLGLLADQFGKGYYLVIILAVFLILLGIWLEAQKYELYKHQTVALPIVININNRSSSEDALNALFQVIEKDGKYKNHKQNLEKYLKITNKDLLFSYPESIYHRERLINFLKLTRYELEKLKEKTPNHTTFYLAYIGPVSVAIPVGNIISTYGVRIFQYQKSSSSYICVAEVKDRRLKENTTEYRKFQRFDCIQSDEQSNERVTVGIDVSSHKLNLSEKSIQNYGDIIYLKAKGGSTIQKDEDWLQYSREIFKTVNEAQRSQYKDIRLVYSMPVALGLILGMALQHYWSITVTNFEKQTYKDVMNLKDLKNIAH